LKTGEYGCPGGKVDENDFSFEDAARRELLEETGLSVEEERLYWIGYQKVATDETDYTCWYVLVLEPNEVLMNTEPEKHGDWVPYKFTETMGLPLSCGTKQVIDVLSEQLIKYRNYNNYKDIFISEELEFENLKKMETYGPIQI
jgi:8-oxo-dGTP pyrophosphatase MutT (NUDIX family)